MNKTSQNLLGIYKILSVLGKGGMGKVYLAEDTVLERKVAIKCLLNEFSLDGESLGRFIQEAKAASALNHPNIITIYEIGKEDKTHYIVTEFIEGKTLREIISKKALTIEEAVSISIQVAKGLVAAHRAGIIHRDIKPENIMIRNDGYVKILDFGVAKLTETGAVEDEITVGAKSWFATQSGMIVGTFSYMSPEQANSRRVDGRSDIFSFGIVLFEMLTQHLPFEGKTPIEQLVSIVHLDALSLEDFISNIPSELQNISRKTLQKKPEERYQTSEELLADLENFQGFLKHMSYSGTQSVQLKKIRTEQKSEPISDLDENLLLLIDFTNLTGDEIFDKTLKLALGSTIDQSPSIKIIDEVRVQNALRLMELDADKQINAEIGREICLREGVKAYIKGTIANLGTVYMITLEAVNAVTGNSLGRVLEQAESKEKVLESLGKAATGIRKILGENISSIEKFDVPLRKVTTSSLEALKYYTSGVHKQKSADFRGAILFYEKAVELDPNFASAYLGLAIQNKNIKNAKLAAQNTERAYQLREQVSEIEKLRITYFYYANVKGEIEKSIETLELCNKIFPRYEWTHVSLSHQYMVIGQYEKALNEAREATSKFPENKIAYANLISNLIHLGNFEEAEETFLDARKQDRVNEVYNDWSIPFDLACAKGDFKKMQELIDERKGKTDEYFALNWQTKLFAYNGQIKNAKESSRRSVEFAKQDDTLTFAARFSAGQALRDVFWHYPNTDSEIFKTELAKQAIETFAIERNRFTLTRMAIALALTGQTKEVEQIVMDLEEDFPKDTLVQKLWLPSINASIALFAKNTGKALEELEIAGRFESAAEFIPKYLRGLTYLSLENFDKASKEFEYILNNRGEALMSELIPLAQLNKARALHDLTEYKVFLQLWKDADSDAPPLMDARREMKQLERR